MYTHHNVQSYFDLWPGSQSMSKAYYHTKNVPASDPQRLDVRSAASERYRPRDYIYRRLDILLY